MNKTRTQKKQFRPSHRRATWTVLRRNVFIWGKRLGSWGNCTKSSLVFWKTKRKIGAIACSGDVWGVLACKSHRFAEMSKELKEEAIIQCNCQHFSPLEHIYDDNAWIAWVSILIIMMIIIMTAAIIQCDCQHFLPKDAHTMNPLF